MRCEDARQLFDVYLDGALSAPLVTELGVHRVQCPQCRRELALLEVAGHIVASEQDETSLPDGFTDRLLDCVESPASRGWARWRLRLYVGGPLAAAAVIAMAFLGFFDREPGQVLGNRENVPAVLHRMTVERAESVRNTEAEPNRQRSATPNEDRLFQEWLRRAQESLQSKRQSSESLQSAFDLTVLQLLEILAPTPPLTDAESPVSTKPKPSADGDDVEDM